MTTARRIRVRGVVQGVGFRPFVYRLARARALAGWVANGEDGVEIVVEGADASLDEFLRELRSSPPAAARIAALEVDLEAAAGFEEFAIRESRCRDRPTARIAPDIAVCEECLAELFDPRDRRFHYPYITCTNCGPRYTVTRRLPYDRCNTTMAPWPLDAECSREYDSPGNRRFHAQPIACPACGPHYHFVAPDEEVAGDDGSIARAAALLTAGHVVAVKGLGGYHLACDARQPLAVLALRERKYRKEKPFALMAHDLEIARETVDLSPEAEALLLASVRPIVLAPARADLPGVAPDHDSFGVMLPYAPLHHLLFAAGAPPLLVMTSANRSSEPIAYDDADARLRLAGLADGFLVGERPIARRVDDSVVRDAADGPVVLRRARGYAPAAVTILPTERPILAVGGDLKNAITLVVGGQAFVSQHVGDLDEASCRRAFLETIDDLLAMYEIARGDLLVIHDAHPQYVSTSVARELPAGDLLSVQHHRAHVASVIAEHDAWDTPVVAAAFDGTGYGDDGAIWGGELFVGSVRTGFERVGSLRPTRLAGGDAAARYPVQAAAGFLAALDGLPDLTAPPFNFPRRFAAAAQLLERDVRSFPTTSMGRLFDTVAALLGFTRAITFEGQAAMWLEALATRAGHGDVEAYTVPFDGNELDYRPLLESVVCDRLRGLGVGEIARAFHRGLAAGATEAIARIAEARGVTTVVLSGGVFQNDLLLREMKTGLTARGLGLWTNHEVPPNDGGLSLGQAAIGAMWQQAAGGAAGDVNA